MPDQRGRTSRPRRARCARRRNVRSRRPGAPVIPALIPRAAANVAPRAGTTQTMAIGPLAAAATPGRPRRRAPLATLRGPSPEPRRLTLDPRPIWHGATAAPSLATRLSRTGRGGRKTPRLARSTHGPTRLSGARMARRAAEVRRGERVTQQGALGPARTPRPGSLILKPSTPSLMGVSTKTMTVLVRSRSVPLPRESRPRPGSGRR